MNLTAAKYCISSGLKFQCYLNYIFLIEFVGYVITVTKYIHCYEFSHFLKSLN